MFALAQAPPDHAHRLRTQRNRRTSFCGRRFRCGADLIAAVGDRCPVGATADRSRAADEHCCTPASGPLAGPRGRRCSSVEGAYPNAGGAVPLEDPLTTHQAMTGQEQREQNWSIGRADHGAEVVSTHAPSRRSVYVRRVLGQGRGSPTVKRGPIAGERTCLRAHKQAPERVRDGVSRVCQLVRPPLLLMIQPRASAAVRISPSYLV